jgi:uncharacterized pyridoxal phosphate-dependent enzyme
MNRRDIFRGMGRGLLATVAAKLPLRAASKQSKGLYESLGVRPMINCRGTYTIISGSQSLPEVKVAMDEASRHYVHLDELMEAVGRRLSELTKAEWGIVTAGCAAALTHSTAACLVGANPEKMQRLPNVEGLKREVVMPRASRNVYDHAIRMTGVTMVTPETYDQFMAALRPATAMVAILGENLNRHPMPLEAMTEAAHKRGIPVLVDAAAERLTIPNFYLGKGADLVAYSGGKCLRGPQSAGLLLGRKDLVQAAWINSAPHHAFGRSLKVGKEEIMGMLAAVEAWTKRDHDAEWKQWETWLETFRQQVADVPTVHTEKILPEGPSNNAPQLRISWDTAKVGATGREIAAVLYSGEPRIALHEAESSVTIMPYMMMPGDDRVAAGKLRAALLHPPQREVPAAVPGETSVAGQWDVHLEFVRGEASHTLYLEEKGGAVRGQHRAEFLAGDVRGTRQGGHVHFSSSHRYEGTSLGYTFDGTVTEGEMTGTVDLGEYGKARFTAKRHWA